MSPCRLSLTLAALLLPAAAFAASDHAHDHGHAHEPAGKSVSFGQPGDPAAPARDVDVTMKEGDGQMSFAPVSLHVKAGEQVRFVLKNDGALAHEFRVSSVADNRAHAAMMAAMPDMKHREPNQTSLEPGASGTLVWRFNKPGTYEYACLVPGHYEAGMHGTLVVE